jgi:hypothetical protein
MSKLILNIVIVMAGLFISGLILFGEVALYYDQPLNPITCSFVKFDWPTSSDTIKMKLSCNGKEYASSDSKLILWHIENPDKEISGMLKRDGSVISKDK